VVCYPSHTTHVLQGLDVVVFAVVKHCLSEERDRWERETGEAISKSNFLAIYGRAHTRALTPETIFSAFRKTGIWPFNRDVISKEAMAPSKETSCEAHLPAEVAPEIVALAKLLRGLSLQDTDGSDAADAVTEVRGVEHHVEHHDKNEGDAADTSAVEGVGHGDEHGSDGDGRNMIEGAAEASASTEPVPNHMVKTIIDNLAGGPLVYLVSSTPAVSTDAPPSAARPIPPRVIFMKDFVPTTAVEAALLSHIRDGEDREEALRQHLMEVQASNVLNEMYCAKLRGQLASYEKKGKKGGKGKLMGDVLPCFLSGDVFNEKVVEFETRQRQDRREKASRREAREGIAEALALWKEEEKARKQRNVVRRERYQEAVKEWEQERDAVKAPKRRFRVVKPTQEGIEKPVARPKPSSAAKESSEDEEDDEEGEDDDQDND
jgi:hypothetical protein